MTTYEISGNLGDWFSENCVGTQYDRVYVSIGGKFNQKVQNFNYPEEVKNKIYHSNAGYQMIPAFLRNAGSSSTLVILVDMFCNDGVDPCRQVLSSIMQTNLHIDVALVNLNISLGKTLKYLIRDIVNFVIQREIPSNKFMICNFIRFSHPNVLEQALEEYVPIKIQRYLNKNPVYINCFYQWYGCSIYTYNLIYQYRQYHMIRCMHYSLLLRLFERVFRTFSINSSCINLAQMGVDNMSTQKALDSFLRYSIDFTENYAQTESLVENLGHYTYH
jgi:hypothetical protein